VSLVVLVILAIVWAVFLLPQLVRARAERSSDSIGAFRNQLSVLERTTPATSSRSVTQLRSASRSQASLGGRPGQPRQAPPAPRQVPAARRPAGSARPHSRHAAGRALARKRRRDVLCGLLVAMGVTLVLGLLPPLRMLLVVHLLVDALFAGYVALLIRARNVAVERDLKVRFLPGVVPAQPALLLRRSAN
jgi:Flp pilus assembly protein TadB